MKQLYNYIISDEEIEQYIKSKYIHQYNERRLNKTKRRYMKYLNEIYVEPFVIAGRDNNYYKTRLIREIIINKWLNRKIRRLK